jgi:hypothetical protein
MLLFAWRTNGSEQAMQAVNISAASAVETDFWMDADLKEVWDEIAPREPRAALRHKLTYARPSGERR